MHLLMQAPSNLKKTIFSDFALGVSPRNTPQLTWGRSGGEHLTVASWQDCTCKGLTPAAAASDKVTRTPPVLLLGLFPTSRSLRQKLTA